METADIDCSHIPSGVVDPDVYVRNFMAANPGDLCDHHGVLKSSCVDCYRDSCPAQCLGRLSKLVTRRYEDLREHQGQDSHVARVCQESQQIDKWPWMEIAHKIADGVNRTDEHAREASPEHAGRTNAKKASWKSSGDASWSRQGNSQRGVQETAAEKVR